MIMLPWHSQQLCAKTVFHKPYNHKSMRWPQRTAYRHWYNRKWKWI